MGSRKFHLTNKSDSNNYKEIKEKLDDLWDKRERLFENLMKSLSKSLTHLNIEYEYESGSEYFNIQQYDNYFYLEINHTEGFAEINCSDIYLEAMSDRLEDDKQRPLTNEDRDEIDKLMLEEFKEFIKNLTDPSTIPPFIPILEKLKKSSLIQSIVFSNIEDGYEVKLKEYYYKARKPKKIALINKEIRKYSLLEKKNKPPSELIIALNRTIGTIRKKK